MRKHHFTHLEPELAAEDVWVEHVNTVANYTLYPLANSWYLGANIPGKPRIFMPYVGGVGNYRLKCQEISEKGYEGFFLTTYQACFCSRPVNLFQPVLGMRI